MDEEKTYYRSSNGYSIKKNLSDSLSLIKNISSLLSDDYEFVNDTVDSFYDDIQKVVDDLVFMYGCQEVDNKIQ